MAAQIAAHIGRPVAAVQQPLAEWQAANRGLPPYAQQALSAMFEYYDAHDFAASSRQLELLLGRPPVGFEEFLKREVG